MTTKTNAERAPGSRDALIDWLCTVVVVMAVGSFAFDRSWQAVGLCSVRLAAAVALSIMSSGPGRGRCRAWRAGVGAGGLRGATALVLLALVGAAQSEPVTLATLGTIAGAIGTVWTVISTIATLIVYALLILKFLTLWMIAFVIAVIIFINVFDGFGALANFSATRWIDDQLGNALQCEPIDPEHGEYREELYKGERPSPFPSVIARRKRDDAPLPSASPGPGAQPDRRLAGVERLDREIHSMRKGGACRRVSWAGTAVLAMAVTLVAMGSIGAVAQRWDMAEAEAEADGDVAQDRIRH